MSNGDTHVRPGEVISSSLINQILDRLAALEAAQSGPATGPSGPIVIDGFEPAIEVPVGRLLAVLGSNLPFPPTANSVTIGGFPVLLSAFLPTSTTARLEFMVPDLGTVPAEGRDLFVRVRSGAASAQRLFHFLPAVDAVPPADITHAHAPGQPDSTPIQIGTKVVVEGTHFAANPQDNVIKLTPMGVASPTVYPTAGNPLVFDTAASGPQAIVFDVPDMSEVTGPPRRIKLEVSNGQNPVADVAEFFAFR